MWYLAIRRPLVRTRMPTADIAEFSRRLARLLHIKSPRRNGVTEVVDGSVLDYKAAPSQRRAQLFTGRWLLRVDPDDQHPRRRQEIKQAVQRRFKNPECSSSPVNQRDVVLCGRKSAICHRCRSVVAAASQFEHQFDTPGACYDDSVLS